MPPRTRFDREHIIDATFELMRKEGTEAITARRIADEMSSSVGPIYSQFANIEDLQEAAKEKARKMLEEYTGRNWSDIPFLNMGVGFVCFARDEPILFEICCSGGPGKPTGEIPDGNTLDRLREDPMLAGFSDEELTDIFRKLSVMAYGMAALASQGSMEDDSDEAIIGILKETGGDIMFMTRARALMKDPERDPEAMKELRGYIDERR